MRLFFALWPDDASQQHWLYATDTFIKALGGKPQPASNLHLTLHFLGEVDGSRVNTLTQLGNDAAAETIALRFNRIECWHKADIACLRPDNDPPALSQLVSTLAIGLKRAGFALEKHQFKSHVTLARHLTHHEPALPLWPVLQWQADTLALVRSRLTPNGAVYSPIAQWPLT